PPQYISAQAAPVKPIVLKKSITMPNAGLEAIKQFEPNNPSGFANFINRAYFVVKNQLYLWDFAESRDLVIHEEEDAIVGIGFVKPKPQVFKEEIKQLLIISTVREIKIIALKYNSVTGLEVFATDMITSSSGVNINAIVGTEQGRIFMLGDDGNVWELDYRSQEGWFTGKCTKKIHTPGSGLSFLFGGFAKDPIVQLAVNESGTVLYQLTASSSIYVTYLGNDGYTFNTVYRKTDVLQTAKMACPSTHYLTGKDFKIVSIQPTTALESTSYHLVAITNSGLRIYFSHHTESQHLIYDAPPNNLVITHVRSPEKSMSTADNIHHPVYNNALFMFVQNQHASATQDKIIIYSPDLGNLSNCISPASNMSLAEFHDTIDIHGKVLSISESPEGTQTINDMTIVPYYAPTRYFFILTTSGVYVLAKQRPVDMLSNLLSLAGNDIVYRLPEFEHFFSHFGYVNCSTLCYNLISSNMPVLPNSVKLYSPDSVATSVAQGAKVLLDRFGQVPSLLNQMNEHQYTSRHDGLALFIYRLVQPIWTKQLVQQDVNKVYSSTVSIDQLKNTQNGLKNLMSFMDQHPDLFPKTTDSPEARSFNNLRELISYLADALSFFIYLIETGISSVVQLMKPDSQQHLLQQDLKTLLTTSEGRSLTHDLLSALIQFSFNRYDNSSYVVDVLTQHCGSFCGASDVLLYKAASQIYSARTATNTLQARALLNDSFMMLTKIASSIPADKATEIADEFASQGNHLYGTRLALECIKARDPHHDTTGFVEAGCPPHDPRALLFKAKKPFYDIVFKLVCDVVLKNNERETHRKDILNAVFNYRDKAFHFYMYEKFIENQMGQDLIKESPPYLEEFLNRKPCSFDRLRLLADYYRRNEKYEEAAHSYIALGRAA
ncbi:hypothetical protein CU098_000350, partial [Rhizopus stolonifer]